MSKFILLLIIQSIVNFIFLQKARFDLPLFEKKVLKLFAFASSDLHQKHTKL